MLLLWLSRQIEVNSNQVEILIENNQHYTMQEIADILRISKSIKLLVKMKNVLFILWKKNHMDFLANPVKKVLGFHNSFLVHVYACNGE